MTPSPSYEEYTALSLALEASRSEGAALRLAYGYEHDRYTALKEAHDKVSPCSLSPPSASAHCAAVGDGTAVGGRRDARQEGPDEVQGCAQGP